MKRTYLEEDLEMIQRYFPGATTVALRTPFDLTPRGQHLPRLKGSPIDSRQGGILWLS